MTFSLVVDGLGYTTESGDPPSVDLHGLDLHGQAFLCWKQPLLSTITATSVSEDQDQPET